MNFDPENKIVKLCVKGMEADQEEAQSLFQQAWDEASDDLEKFIAAHYFARSQKSVNEKLEWDLTALNHAHLVKDEKIQGTFPSLYLNIAKCYEDLHFMDKAKKYYELASSFTHYLQADGYGNMIRSGIQNGMKRLCL